MRDLKVIYDEVSRQCHKDNCQSVQKIAILAMEIAINEYKIDIINKITKFTDNLE